MNLEQHYFESIEQNIWEENQQTIALSKGKYKKSFKRWGHVACLFGGFMFVFGGEVDTTLTEVPHCIYKIGLEDILNNLWSQVCATSKGIDLKGRDSFSAVVHEKRWLLLFGNCMGVSTNEILQYDFVNQAFSRVLLKKPTFAREGHASALIHNRFVVSYGGVSVFKKRSTEVDRGHKLSVWDLKEENFVDISDEVIANSNLFKHRKCHTLTEVSNQIVVFGGSTVNSVNRTNPDDLLSDMFLIQINFFRYQDKSIKIDDPNFVMISNDIYAKVSFVRVEYQGPRLQLHSHNASVLGKDLIIFTCGEIVIRDGNRNRVVCNTYVYGYSISGNTMFEISQLADKMPKRICSTAVSYLNGLFIYGGYNNQKKYLNSISIVTFNLQDKTLYPRTFSVDGRSAKDMDSYELSYKMIHYAQNRKNEIVNSRYGRRLFENNQIM